MRSLGWALIQYDCVFIKRRNLDTDIHTQGADDVKTQIEHHLQECLRPREVRREAWNRLSFMALRRNLPC